MYSASKSALNSLMKRFSRKRPDDSRAMLLLAPGFVRTDMGGPGAHFSIEDSIPHLVDVVQQHRGVAGLQFVECFGKNLPW
jgi:NAD(P)-dependent dehydrogenase (short-subunit alcohol dehydrogenase family)